MIEGRALMTFGCDEMIEGRALMTFGCDEMIERLALMTLGRGDRKAGLIPSMATPSRPMIDFVGTILSMRDKSRMVGQPLLRWAITLLAHFRAEGGAFV